MTEQETLACLTALRVNQLYALLPFKTYSNVLIPVKTSEHRMEIRSMCGLSQARNRKNVPGFLIPPLFGGKAVLSTIPFFGT
jgi:hypothetical protein